MTTHPSPVDSADPWPEAAAVRRGMTQAERREIISAMGITLAANGLSTKRLLAAVAMSEAFRASHPVEHKKRRMKGVDDARDEHSTMTILRRAAAALCLSSAEIESLPPQNDSALSVDGARRLLTQLLQQIVGANPKSAELQLERARREELSIARVARRREREEAAFKQLEQQAAEARRRGELAMRKGLEEAALFVSMIERFKASIRLGTLVSANMKKWLELVRRRHKAGRLSRQQLKELGDADVTLDGPWAYMLHRLVRFKERHGHVLVTNDKDEALVQWINRQRLAWKRQKLPDDRFRALDGVGLSWNPERDAWLERVTQLENYRQLHGHPMLSRNEDPKLMSWARQQATRLDKGLLNKLQQQQLAQALDLSPSVESA